MARSDIVRVLPGSVPWTWGSRGAAFLATFGGIWLLAEPGFALSPIRLSRPVLAYAGMIVTATAVSILAETLARQRRVGRARKLRLTVILTKAGRTVPVETVHDLAVGEFVDGFLRTVTGSSSLACYKPEVVSLYQNNLLVRRGEDFVAVDSRATLREVGIRQGAVCKIGGYVRVEYVFSTLHADDSMQCADVDRARKSGRIILDEDSAAAPIRLEGPGGRAEVWVIDNGPASAGGADTPALADVLNALHRVGYVARTTA